MPGIRIHRDLPASVERVWRAWTTEAELAAWFWPPRFGTVCTIDLRVGGAYRIDGPGAGIAASGAYTAVDAPAALAFSWRWDGDDETTRVTLRLAATDDGCSLDLAHDGFGSDETAAEHVQGWSDCLDRLPAALV
jgi:uncharacterized protein YndB with AHSA1/START domain